MNNQITLLGFEPEDHKETQYLDSIETQILTEIVSHGGEHSFFSRKSNASGYSVVFIGNFTAFRLHLRGKSQYISLPVMFADLIPDTFPIKKLQSDPKYIRLIVNKQHPIESYTNFLVMIAGETINRYPKEWSCCSRYMECSDAKACIHPDKTLALSCGYRKILNSGRIFYGKNRNI